MKTVLVLSVFLAVSGLAPAAEPEKELFYNPMELFSDCLVPALSGSETGNIKKTWRGFYLRADSQSGMRDENGCSSLGIYLDVAVRDPVEIPSFKDTSDNEKSLTKRTVEIPAGKTDTVGLRITLVYGSEANADALAAINKDIAKVVKAAGHAEKPAAVTPAANKDGKRP